MPSCQQHTVRVPATTANLGPGFDAFGLALGLHLAVRSLDRSEQRERVRTDGDGAPELPDGDDNLVWRSLVAFCEAHDAPVPDVALRAATSIPLERGLGSSSAAIVAGLSLGRALTGVPTGDRDLVELASRLEGHPDNVAPALLGGLVACAADDGGRVHVRRVNPAARLRPLVLVPATRQATVTARAVLPARLSRADVTVQAARSGHVLGGLVGLWPVAPALAGDRLHEPARRAVMGPSGALLAELREAGVHAWLSGAGPSLAAVVARREDPVVERVRALAADRGFAVTTPGFDLAGALTCPDGGCLLTGGSECVHCPRRRVS